MNTKISQISLGEITVDVTRKKIKNVHLSVHPPQGRVTISAPLHMGLDTIRIFAISKLDWIRKHQTKLQNQQREAPRDYVTRESHFYLGKRYLLNVIEHSGRPKVELKHDTIELFVPREASPAKREAIILNWYRRQLKEIVPKLIAAWEPKMEVKVLQFGIKKMKTRWGTCNSRAQRIWINLELAKKPMDLIELIVVHEMVHLLERKHGERFKALMTKFLPQWKSLRQDLNRKPVGHAEWEY